MVSEVCPTNPREASGLDPEAVHNTSTGRLVAVTPDGDREHVAELVEASIDEWMAFVAQKRGWTDRRLFETFGDAVAAWGDRV